MVEVAVLCSTTVRPQSITRKIESNLKRIENISEGKGPLGENVKGPYPVVDRSQSTTRLLVQTPRYGKYLGQIEMSINSEGRINSYVTSNPILLDSSVTQGN